MILILKAVGTQRIREQLMRQQLLTAGAMTVKQALQGMNSVMPLRGVMARTISGWYKLPVKQL